MDNSINSYLKWLSG
uniref:Uncharacterized protein n=1 Tax=Arundo donax TaxID=35708 RepID=A0A0A8Z344_ARUDO